MTKGKESKKQWAINKKAQLKERLKEVLSSALVDKEQIKNLTDHYKVSALYQYSFLNSALILSQGGTIAQSYKGWQKLKRQVRKGEKAGIHIYVPAISKKEKPNGEDEEKLFFLLKPVFDISQTEGEPLKFDHNSKESFKIKFDDLKKKVEKLIKKKVILQDLAQARGFVDENLIAVSKFSNNIDKVKTLIHEVAHNQLGHVGLNDLSRDVKEIEAEASTALVLSYLGIDYELTDAYVLGWKQDGNVGKVRINKILSVSEKLIKNLFISKKAAKKAA